MKKIKTLLFIFVTLFITTINLEAVASPESQILDKIKSEIPQKWWIQGSWDKTKELEDFLAAYQANDATGAEARLWLGYNYRVLGLYDNALTEFKKLTTEYPSCQFQARKAQLEIGQIYYWFKKDYDQALLQYQKAVNLYPDTWEATYAQEYVGQCYLAKGDEQRALTELNKAYEKGRIAAGITMSSILLKQDSSLPSSAVAEKQYRDKKFRELIFFYKKLYQTCPIGEEDGAAIAQIIDGITNTFARWDGNMTRSTQFVRFQKYGSLGQDKMQGTSDDLTDPMAEF